MLHAATPSSTTSAADSFFTRLHGQRSLSYDASSREVLQSASSSSSTVTGLQADGGVTDGIGDGLGLGPAFGSVTPSSTAAALFGDAAVADIRRAKTLRAPGKGDAPRPSLGAGLPSFSAVGSTLSSPTPSVAAGYTPPAASRHPLFAHHASPPQPAAPSVTGDAQPPGIDIRRVTSPSAFSDSSASIPPSPTSISSSAFSPASAFLSHFSSTTSLRQARAVVAPDAQGAKVLNYTLGKLLGRGGFSTVRLATRDDGEVFACKIVKRDDLSDRSGSVEKFEEEIKTWRGLPKHQSLLPLLEIHRDGKITYLFMTFMPGGNLLDVLRRENGSDKTARKWFPGVVTAVAAMHEGYGDFKGGLLHGDLKLDNFLVDHNGVVKVCDFYMAQLMEPPVSVPPPQAISVPQRRGRSRPRLTSPYPAGIHDPVPAQLPSTFPSASLPYAPPELLRAPPSPATLAQDIWAVGVILYALLTGKLPFMDEFDPRLQLKILKGQYDEPLHLGREWIEVLRGCLDGDRDRRWTIKRVRESDAVIGWTEVKPKQRSQSRSRSRAPTSGRMPAYDPLTGRPELSHSGSYTRGWQGGGGGYAGGHEAPKSASYVHRHAGGGGGDDMFTPRPPRSRSHSASRSRSSGRNKILGFEPRETPFVVEKEHHDRLVEHLETIDINNTRGRGRSTSKRIDGYGGVQGVGAPAVPDLFFGRQSRDQSTNSAYSHSPHRPHQPPPHQSPNFRSTHNSSGYDMSRGRSNYSVAGRQQQYHSASSASSSYSDVTMISDSRSRSRSRTGRDAQLQPQNQGGQTRASRSRSRSGWEDRAHGWGDATPVGGGSGAGGHLLGVVDEEGGAPPRGRTGRDHSRGRM